MKSRILLFYGYILPFLVSGIISLLPNLLPNFYLLFFDLISKNIGFVIAFFALVVAVTSPFFSHIYSEENIDILIILSKSNLRSVYKKAAIFQAIIILLSSILITVIPIISSRNLISGYILLFLTILIIVESIAIISNWYSYSNIREKIIIEIKKTLVTVHF